MGRKGGGTVRGGSSRVSGVCRGVDVVDGMRGGVPRIIPGDLTAMSCDCAGAVRIVDFGAS